MRYIFNTRHRVHESSYFAAGMQYRWLAACPVHGSMFGRRGPTTNLAVRADGQDILQHPRRVHFLLSLRVVLVLTSWTPYFSNSYSMACETTCEPGASCSVVYQSSEQSHRLCCVFVSVTHFIYRKHIFSHIRLWPEAS